MSKYAGKKMHGFWGGFGGLVVADTASHLAAQAGYAHPNLVGAGAALFTGGPLLFSPVTRRAGYWWLGVAALDLLGGYLAGMIKEKKALSGALSVLFLSDNDADADAIAEAMVAGALGRAGIY
jgi:hypothetical protein